MAGELLELTFANTSLHGNGVPVDCEGKRMRYRRVALVVFTVAVMSQHRHEFFSALRLVQILGFIFQQNVLGLHFLALVLLVLALQLLEKLDHLLV